MTVFKTASVLIVFYILFRSSCDSAAPKTVSPCAMSEKTRCAVMALGLKDICQCLRANEVCYDNQLKGVAPKQVKKSLEPLCKDIEGFMDRCASDLPCQAPTSGQLHGLQGSIKSNKPLFKPKPKVKAKPPPAVPEMVKEIPAKPARPVKPALPFKPKPVKLPKQAKSAQNDKSLKTAKPRSEVKKPSGKSKATETKLVEETTTVQNVPENKFFSRVKDYLKKNADNQK